MSRIGIYAGTFDPIHMGHIAFAEFAMTKARLDEVVFMPERSPRHKHGTTSYDHRLTMVEQATLGIPGMRALAVTEKRFTVDHTLPELQAMFPGATFVFLLGSDVFEYLPSWQDSSLLLATSELAIATRGSMTDQDILEQIQKWPVFPQVFTVITNHTRQAVSSTSIRNLLAAGELTDDVPDAVQKYIREHHLYQA
jgi:nicotinate-nucleotide adenylyltransferase